MLTPLPSSTAFLALSEAFIGTSLVLTFLEMPQELKARKNNNIELKTYNFVRFFINLIRK
jgi:hypothetical protein